jgi:hypothetical protein
VTSSSVTSAAVVMDHDGSKVPESVRSKVRRRVGFRLEKHFPADTRKLRKEYDTPYWRNKWCEAYYARRTEQIRADLGHMHPIKYKQFLEEELNNECNWPSPHHGQ